MPSQDDTRLRQFEEAYLNTHYKTLALAAWEPERAFTALIQAFDNLDSIEHMAATGRVDDTQFLKQAEDGFTQAVHWACSEMIPPAIATPLASEDVRTAIEFLRFAVNYRMLTYMHHSYRKHLVTIETTADPPAVRFTPVSEQISDYADAIATERLGIPRPLPRVNRERLWRSAAEALSVVDGTVCLTNTNALKTCVALIPFSWLKSQLIVLPDDTDLTGFSFGELSEFWRIVHGWSLAASLIATEARRWCRVTGVQRCSIDAFVQTIAGVSCSLTTEAVSTILNRLGVRAVHDKYDSLLQPFFVTHDTVTWVPRSITRSKYQRNALKLMSRTPELANDAATIIGGTDRQLNELVAGQLQRKGYRTATKRTIRVDGQTSDVDVLAYTTRAREQVLFVETKAVWPPDEVYEVADHTDRLIDDQQSCARTVRLLQDASPTYLDNRFGDLGITWSRVDAYCAILMTPDSEPIYPFDGTVIPALSFESMRHHFERQDYATPSSIVDAARERRWSVRNNIPATRAHTPIPVGPVTYEIPTVTLHRSHATEAQ